MASKSARADHVRCLITKGNRLAILFICPDLLSSESVKLQKFVLIALHNLLHVDLFDHKMIVGFVFLCWIPGAGYPENSRA